jgi:internalin A
MEMMENTRGILKAVIGIAGAILVITNAACKLTISSLQGPDTSETGAIINLTITGQGTESSNTTEYGLILQIPEHWEVISANVSVMITQYPLKENLAIESLYSPQPGYKVWAGTTTERYGVLATVSLCVGNLPGNEGDMENYVIKAMAGASRSGTWCTDDPQDVFDFAAVTKSKYLKSITVTKTFDQGIFIPDPNLESAIREALGTGPCDPITQDMAHILTTLNAESRAIFDLSGLEYFLNLTDLDLSDNQISDISPLGGLINLTVLDLGDNQISDISPLSGLINLTDLSLFYNEITDISPLSGLINLNYLNLNSSGSIFRWAPRDRIKDISPLSGLINLTYLDLSGNQITDINPLSGLINLTDLYLTSNQISDITSLNGLINLTDLRLINNQIIDISPLGGLINLTWLSLDDNQISDISPLSGLTNLIILDLDYNQITDISALSGLINLTDLRLINNQITDISPLGGLINLTVLDLGDNQISDISPLSGLINLTGLGLMVNKILEISPLSGLTNLTGLGLSLNQITDISSLSGLTNLIILDLDYNQITDISALSGLINLTDLRLGWNQIPDITALVENTGLGNEDYVNLYNNPLSSAQACADLQTLRDRGVYLGLDPSNICLGDLAGYTDLSDLAVFAKAGFKI